MNPWDLSLPGEQFSGCWGGFCWLIGFMEYNLTKVRVKPKPADKNPDFRIL